MQAIFGRFRHFCLPTLSTVRLVLYTGSVYQFCLQVLSTRYVYEVCLLVLSTSSVYQYCLLVLSTSPVYQFNRLVLSTNSVYQFCLTVQSTTSVYQFCLIVLSIGPVHQFCLLVLSTTFVYQFCLAVLTTSSVYQFCLVLLPSVSLPEGDVRVHQGFHTFIAKIWTSFTFTLMLMRDNVLINNKCIDIMFVVSCNNLNYVMQCSLVQSISIAVLRNLYLLQSHAIYIQCTLA